MRKLLHKPLRAFTLYALSILTISIPAYYWVIERLWFHELDEHNWLVTKRIEKRLSADSLNETHIQTIVQHWQLLHSDVHLSPAKVREKPHVYTINKPNEDDEDLKTNNMFFRLDSKRSENLPNQVALLSGIRYSPKKTRS